MCRAWAWALRSPIQRQLSLQHCYCHDTGLATFMLSGSVRDPAPYYVDSHTNTAHRQYNQLPHPQPTETSSFCVCVCPPRAQRRSLVNFRLSSILERLLALVLSCFMCVTVESFLFSSISALPFPPKMKTLMEIYHPPPSLHVQCFVVLFSFILNETTGCGSFSCCNIPFQSGRCCEASFAKSLSLWI